MTNLPLFYQEEGLFVSHAPWLGDLPAKEIPREEYKMGWEDMILWNRYKPKEVKGIYQVHGHNHVMKKYTNSAGEEWGICIDNCGNKVLTGLHWPDKSLYQVEYE
jgi:hypothetical protein